MKTLRYQFSIKGNKETYETWDDVIAAAKAGDTIEQTFLVVDAKDDGAKFTKKEGK